MIQSTVHILERLSKPNLVMLSVFVLGVVALADFMTGPDLAFSIFYLLPTILVSWYLGRTSGALASIVCIITWLTMDRISARIPPSYFFSGWSALVRLGYFLIINHLLWLARQSWLRERQFASFDALTGLANARWFKEKAEIELERARRYGRPFNLAYIDADNFKQVNDRFGHEAGDNVLRRIGTILNAEVRKSDLAGRLGGDEFAILLTEIDAKRAHEVMTRILNALRTEGEYSEIVSMSMGLVSFTQVTAAYDEIIRMADNLMYAAKREGKNRIVAAIDPAVEASNRSSALTSD